MKIKYNKQNDVLYIQLSDNAIVESNSEKLGIILDFDDKENIVGIEVLNASKKMECPFKVEYEVA